MAWASPSASRIVACRTPSAFLISARRAPSAMVSVAVAKSTAAIFSFSALTTLFMVSCTSLGGSISFSSVRTISMPQWRVSSRRVCCSSLLILPRSLLADFRVMVPMMLRRVVRARLTIWRR